MGTKKVYVKIRKFNNNFPDAVFLGTKRSIGATMTKSGLVNTGLTKEQEKKYLPRVLGMSYDSHDWNKKLSDYFSTLTIKVPFGEEIPLEIGIGKDGDPLNVTDWIKYHFAKIHPEVAMSKEECIGIKVFYINDPEQAIKTSYKKLSIKKEAFKELIKISDKEEVIDMVMHVMGLDTRGLTSNEKELKLESKIEKIPEKFIEIVKDKDLEVKAFIESCVASQVLDKIGSSYIDGDETIGSSNEETVKFLKDKTNSGVLVKLKARLESFDKSK